MNVNIDNRDLKKYIAELLGTFILTATVALSVSGPFGVLTPLFAAVIVGVFVYSIGSISGAHLNPAITVGAWSIGRMKPQDAISYIVAQFAGAAVAMLLLSKGLGMIIPGGAMMPIDWMVVLAEVIGTFFFAFGIASVVYGKTPADASGLVIGSSLFMGIILATAFGSKGLLNPAVAFGVNSLNLMYVLGPVVGAVLGMWVYRWLSSSH